MEKSPDIRSIHVSAKPADRSVNVTEDKDLQMDDCYQQLFIQGELVARMGSWKWFLDSNMMYASPGAQHLYGINENCISIEEVKSFRLPAYNQLLDEAARRLIEENVPYDVDFKITRKSDGKIIDLNSKATYNKEEHYILGTIQDITEHKLIEEETKKQKRIFEFIANTNELMLRAKTAEEIYQEICSIAVENGNFVFAWIGIPDSKAELIKPHYWAGREEGYLKNIHISTKDIPEGRGQTGNAFRFGKYYYCNDIGSDPAMKIWKDAAHQRNFFSSIALPLKSSGKVESVLNLYASGKNFFSEDEIQLLVKVTNNISYALNSLELDNKRRRAEEELNKFKLIADHSISFIGIADMEDNILYMNQSMRNVLGIQDTADLHQFSRSQFYSTGSNELNHLIWEEIKKNGYWVGENQMLSLDGRKIDVLQTVILIYDENGIPQYTSVTSIDNTRSKKQQNQIREERNFLLTLIEGLPGFFYMYDKKGKFYKWNHNFELLTGFNREEIKNMHPADFYDLPERELVRNRIASVFNGEAPASAEIKIFTKDRRKVPLMINSWKIDYNGEAYLVGVGLDLTEIKEKQHRMQLLADIIEHSTAYVSIVNYDRTFMYLNKAGRKILGIGDEEDITSYSILDFRSDQANVIIGEVEQAMMSTGKWEGENSYVSKNGRLIPVIQTLYLHTDEDDQMTHVSATSIDITLLKAKEAELKRLAGIIENTMALVTICDLQYRIIYMNNTARQRMGITLEEDLMSLSALDFIGATTLESLKEIESVLYSKGKWVGEVELRSRTGTTIPTLEVILMHQNEGQDAAYLSFTSLDITDRKKDADEMKRLNTELRELSTHLQDIREEERSQIAKEIHDEFSQNLVALVMNASILKSKLKDKNDNITELMDQQLEIAEEILKTSRNLFNSLHPSMLDELGLEAAINWYVKPKLKLSDLLFEFHSDIQSGNERIRKDINLGFFRIFQESFTNILKHANASKLIVELIETATHFTMLIKDNGIGFDADQVDIRNSHGLLVIRERVYAINGQLSIDSERGKGTTISVSVALQ